MTNEKLVQILEDPQSTRPLVVAELSGNHNQSLSRALELIDAAAACGADAIKLQTYTADTITLDIASDDFVVNHPGSQWHGRTLYSLYNEAHTPWEWHAPMVKHAQKRGLAWFSSPFDLTAIEFLEQLSVPVYKIASPEIVDLELIAAAAKTGKPLVISTGMASLSEITEAVEVARSSGCKTLALLKCTTSYPAAPDQANLRTMVDLHEKYGCITGVSDHSLGITVAVSATVLGARLIEKHLTLRRADGGPDSQFSMEPEEFKVMVQEVHAAASTLGAVVYGGASSEQAYKRGRRSLYTVVDIKAGEIISRQNIKSIRPGFGLAPRYIDLVIGKIAKVDLKRGTPLSMNDLSSE